ncbi:PQQ-binding-like beta-propeller repeat protein [Phytoactinopolyspora endophytica]|uniref:outer membrane protein assembly factor BamB family protein n=1 Tax=Phytoactinopolyspora endophytica TaxID=1642495 RepID=UPI00101C2057|nr:PQQ-binding-like beta-propeller repeat protein [Phytoactinopolyspora endophytica]
MTVVTIGIMVVALAAALIMAYPAWSARRGGDAVWVVDHAVTSGGLSGRSLLDYDDDRLLISDDQNSLAVRSREDGEELFDVYSQQLEPIAALVPSGVVHSDHHGLHVIDDDGSVRWEVLSGADDVGATTLVAVDVEEGHVVAAVDGREVSDPKRLVAYGLDDGDIRWELPDVGRAGFTDQGEPPRTPPGALRQARVYPVVFNGDFRDDGESIWSLVDTRDGDVVREITTEGVPVATGEFVFARKRQACAEVTVFRMDQEVQLDWQGEVPSAECDLVWSVSEERAYLAVPAEAREFDRVDDLVHVFYVDLNAATLTELEWEGPRDEVDGTTPGPADASRSWSSHFYGSDGTMYDVSTGAAAWELDDPDAFGAWSAGDTAVVTSALSRFDRFVTDGTETSLWYHVVDVETGEPRGGRFIGRWPSIDVAVLDQGQAVILSEDQIALLE